LKTFFTPTGTLAGLRPILLGLESIAPAGAGPAAPASLSGSATSGRKRSARAGNIENALHLAAERIKARSLIILISDLLQDSAEIMRGIRHLHHNGHDLMILHILDDNEIRFAMSGLTELRELETGHKLIVDADDIKGTYQQAVERHLDSLRRGCMNCRADYHLLNTSQPVDETLFMRIASR
jgi:hypothetical protein